MVGIIPPKYKASEVISRLKDQTVSYLRKKIFLDLVIEKKTMEVIDEFLK